MLRSSRFLVALSLLLGAFGCSESPAPQSENAPAEQPAEEAPAAEEHAGHEAAEHEGHEAEAEEAPQANAGPQLPPPGEERLYGAALSDAAVTPLAEITANPQGFSGQTIKTEGEITQVCQRMGCWMEMRAEGATPVRVPMAGHNFFLPKEASGRNCTIEGEVVLRELTDDEREHLASEGAQILTAAMQINATGVVIR